MQLQLSLSARPGSTVRSVAGGGMCSLTAPFHLDKDFQGHVRFSAGSSPAPVQSQACSPGPWCAFPPSTSPGHQHNLSHSCAAAFLLARSQLPGVSSSLGLAAPLSSRASGQSIAAATLPAALPFLQGQHNWTIRLVISRTNISGLYNIKPCCSLGSWAKRRARAVTRIAHANAHSYIAW